MFDVLLVSYDSALWLPPCLARLRDAGLSSDSVIVVDNASTDGSADLVAREFPDVRLIRSGTNLGFGGGANVGLRASEADIVVLMNPDVTVRPPTITALVAALEANPRAAIAGAKLLYPDGKTIQHAGGTLSYPLALPDHRGYRQRDRGQFDASRPVEYVTGALFAVRKSALDEIGYFDEGFFPAYFEETDLCRRARDLGHEVLYVPAATAIHHESATTGQNTPRYYKLFHHGRLRYVFKHYCENQLIADFLPVEAARLCEVPSIGELDALRQAYDSTLGMLEGRPTQLPNPQAVASITDSYSRRRGLACLIDEVSAEVAARRARESRGVQRRLLVHEPSFTSPSPVVGPAIVGLRRFWNWMSTKWYVRDVIRQQNAINWRLASDLRTLEGRVAELETRLAEARESLDSRPTDSTAVPGNADHLLQADRL